MPIQRGDIIELGPHRLMCGDCTNRADVQRLFGDLRANLVFTSPPYLSKRKYGEGTNQASCWTSMMNNFFIFPYTDVCQVFVNLGHCHSNNEWHPYWADWLESLRTHGWRRFGMYIWDTNMPLPGHAHGRLLSRYEMVFHVHRRTRFPNKIVKTLGGGINKVNGCKVAVSQREKGTKQDWDGRYVQDTKPLDNIVKATRCRERATGHPARFPVDLAVKFILSYTQRDDICYDPFAGVGTTMLASESTSRVCLSMEIEPEYCQSAVDRYWRHKEKQLAAKRP